MGFLVYAHYVGKLENGKVFDSSYNRGKPLTFRVGVDPARFYEAIVRIVPQSADGCTNIYGTGSVSENQLSGKVKDASVVTHELRLIKSINGGAQVNERVCVCCLGSTSGSVVLLFISSANIVSYIIAQSYI
ncbi:hypothetical protein ACFX2K_033540 [Malus domestica]